MEPNRLIPTAQMHVQDKHYNILTSAQNYIFWEYTSLH
jgi:hypothetical protein